MIMTTMRTAATERSKAEPTNQKEDEFTAKWDPKKSTYATLTHDSHCSALQCTCKSTTKIHDKTP